MQNKTGLSHRCKSFLLFHQITAIPEKEAS